MSVCLTGAVDQRSPSNLGFERMCDREPIPGLLRECERHGCYASFDSFTDSARRTIYPRIFEALDTNEDGQVDTQDESCELNLIGFSWGGVAATKLAVRLTEDERISPERRQVTRMLLLDPYRPGVELDLPENVQMARVWRQSASPPLDCSSSAPGGPYRGLPLDCPEGRDCLDVDISQLDYTLSGYVPGSQFEPHEIGHCMVPEVARDWVMDALYDHQPPSLSNPELRRDL